MGFGVGGEWEASGAGGMVRGGHSWLALVTGGYRWLQVVTSGYAAVTGGYAAVTRWLRGGESAGRWRWGDAGGTRWLEEGVVRGG